MIGAGKLNEKTDDLERLHKLFEMGFNNTLISKIYKTNSGESISRIHVSQIRRGKRWNSERRSFFMKSELLEQQSIETLIGGKVFKTVISQVISENQLYYMYLTYIDGTPMVLTNTVLMVKKPNEGDLISHHTKMLNGASN